MSEYLTRGVEARLRSSLERDPLVILEGARATGKSRLVEHALSKGWLREVTSFVDPALLSAAQAAPRDFVRGLPHGTAIDEAQLCPAIMLPLKERIENAEPGSILLTGSTRLHRDELGGSDPFAGRVGRTLQLGPLTLGEQSGQPIDLVSQLFSSDPMTISVGSPFMRSDLVALLDRPGLPGFVALHDRALRRERSQEYLRQVLSRSPFDSLDTQRVNRLARHLAARTSTLLNVQQFGQATELSRESVNKYVARLEEALVLVRLRGWRRSKDKSETDKPKMHFFDAGVAAGVGLMRPNVDDQDLGRLTETLVVTDLVRQCEWQSQPPSPFHWRDRNRDEVDLTLEHADGRVILIEVKASEQVDLSDFRGIDAFRQAHDQIYSRGFVFYSGSRILPFGEDRWAVPFAALRSRAAGESSSDSIGDVVAAARRRRRLELDSEQRASDVDRDRQADRRASLAGAVEAQLRELAASLPEYESRFDGHGDVQTPILARSLHVRPVGLQSDWSALVNVFIGTGEIRLTALPGQGESKISQALDDRPPMKAVIALFGEAADALGVALAELDTKFGL